MIRFSALYSAYRFVLVQKPRAHPCTLDCIPKANHSKKLPGIFLFLVIPYFVVINWHCLLEFKKKSLICLHGVCVFLSLSFCLSLFLSAYVSVLVCFCLSVCACVCLFFLFLSMCASVCVSMYICMFVCMHLSVCLCACCCRYLYFLKKIHKNNEQNSSLWYIDKQTIHGQ